MLRRVRPLQRIASRRFAHVRTVSNDASVPFAAPPPDAMPSDTAVDHMALSLDSLQVASSPPPPLGYWPPDIALRAIELVHEQTHLPWWAAIVGCTLVVRTALLPVALHATRQMSIMQGLRTQIAPLQTRIQASGGTDMVAAAELQALYDRHGVSPVRMLAAPLAQLPVFMSFFLGLRRLSDAFPSAHEGGAYWFVDLGACDTSYLLPAASGFSALALVRLSMPGAPAGASADEALQVERMRLLMSAITAVSLPVAATMPNAVLMFWISNNAFSLVYTATLQMVQPRLARTSRPVCAHSSLTPPV